ncbi:hypothetical protein [Novosphingobium malaysiense]|uniref:hypothetical protein n=1 Tax=Novosphingobium malaysiense TaxID=1348853 RepID=UPI0012E0A19C|nr:hypothetical protein [Novosphingobium malaysiense]
MNKKTAFYYYKFEGLQVGANTIAPDTGNTLIKTVNAASAKVYGVEFDVSYCPPSIKGHNLRLAINWNLARFQDFRGATCDNGQTISDGCKLVVDTATDRFVPVPAGQLAMARDLSGTRLRLDDQRRLRLRAARRRFAYLELRLESAVLVEPPDHARHPLRLAAARLRQAHAIVNFKADSGARELSAIGNNLTNKYTTATARCSIRPATTCWRSRRRAFPRHRPISRKQPAFPTVAAKSSLA